MRGKEKHHTNGAVEMIDEWIWVQIGRKEEIRERKKKY